MRGASVLLAGLFAAIASAEGPSASQGVETLPTGVKLAWTRHFDRNALRGGCVAGDAFLALTESNVLLRFDMGTFKLSGERAVDRPVTAFADVPGIGPMIAMDNGDVLRVAPKTLELHDQTTFPRAPIWIGGRKNGDGKTSVVAVMSVVAESRPTVLWIQESHPPDDGPPAMALRPCVDPTQTARHLHLDSRGRLWFGGNHGEWGGWCSSLNLNAGREAQFTDFRRNVRGFLEWPGAEVWAYGGVNHGEISAYIFKFDGMFSKPVFEFPDLFLPDRKNEAALPPRRPRDIIQRMVVEPGGKSAIVLTETDWFRVDRELKNWKHLGKLAVDRPDRSYLRWGIRFVSAHALPAPGWVLAATAQDGLVEFSDGKAVSHALADQFPGHIDRITTTDAGDVLEDTSYNYRGWIRSGGKWADVPGPDWDYRSFATPDGAVWSTEGELPMKLQLKRRTDKGWVDAGTSDCDLWRPVTVSSVGKGWLLRANEKLLRLMPQADGRMSLTTLVLPVGEVFDAFELAPGRVMLATEFGLKTFDAATGKLGETAMANFADSIRRITRDGRGRMCSPASSCGWSTPRVAPTAWMFPRSRVITSRPWGGRGPTPTASSCRWGRVAWFTCARFGEFFGMLADGSDARSGLWFADCRLPRPDHFPSVRISMPSAVIANVCSKWAE